MAYETISFAGRHKSFHHLEIELCFRAMLRAVQMSTDTKLQAAAQSWAVGLEYISVGLVNVDFSPPLEAEDAPRLTDLLRLAEAEIPKDERISVSELNQMLGSNIQTTDGYLDREIVSAAFKKFVDFVNDV